MVRIIDLKATMDKGDCEKCFEKIASLIE